LLKKKAPLELSPEFTAVLDSIEKSGKNVFVTGRAGTGKSTLLQLLRDATRKNTVVLAYTGVAALHVKGQTIHSFFGFPPRFFHSSEIKKRKDRRIFKKLELLIIDEISMVRADLLDHIDYFLRINRNSQQPFGGVQVALFGDLFQLPPVIASDEESFIYHSTYPSPYFFSARVFLQGLKMEMIELTKVYRQDNKHFLRLLDNLRLNHADQDDLDALNSRHHPDFQPEGFYITLTARNATADAINQRELAKLKGREICHQAKVSGNFNPALFPTDSILRLKTDAQVMLLKNDPERQYANGTVGRITKISDEALTVAIEEGGQTVLVTVERSAWEMLRYSVNEDEPDKIQAETIGVFEQFPVKLAWAVTIHKAQGKTFDRVIIDLGKGAFEHGQTYVALSRCRTLEGIILRQAIRQTDILTDERVVDFYERFIR
jgi:ATP-dependent exoDNAse (exonuclease V) alpha subunit